MSQNQASTPADSKPATALSRIGALIPGIFLCILVAGVSALLERAELGVFEHPTGGAYRGRDGVLTVPSELAGVISGVFGIDTRPLAEPHVRREVRGE